MDEGLLVQGFGDAWWFDDVSIFVLPATWGAKLFGDNPAGYSATDSIAKRHSTGGNATDRNHPTNKWRLFESIRNADS